MGIINLSCKNKESKKGGHFLRRRPLQKASFTKIVQVCLSRGKLLTFFENENYFFILSTCSVQAPPLSAYKQRHYWIPTSEDCLPMKIYSVGGLRWKKHEIKTENYKVLFLEGYFGITDVPSKFYKKLFLLLFFYMRIIKYYVC